MRKVPRKLIKETKRLVRLRQFLDQCGLSKQHFSVEELRRLAGRFKKVKKDLTI